MSTCCGARPTPSTDLDFKYLGCPCDTWAHMKDQFIYLKDERAGVIPCKPDQFRLQWSHVDAMTYLMIVTDKLTGEVIEYSVPKEFTFESPDEAFARDYREKEIRHNRGIVRAIDDTLEAFEELNPQTPYKLSYGPKGYYIHRPIQKDLGVICWKVEYGVDIHEIPVPWEDWHDKYPEFSIEIPDIAPKIAGVLVLLIKRMRKAGVHFERVDYRTIDDLKTIEIIGASYRNNMSRNTVKIVYQEMDLTKQALSAYHEFYTDKGPQNGYYNC